MKQLTTTLNKICSHSPCEKGYKKLLKHLGKTEADDEPLPFEVILESNGLDDALWCCRAAPEYDRAWRLFAVWCALQVKHLMTDERSLNALVVAERFANGMATSEELTAAGAAAGEAARAAARAAAGDAQKEVFLWVVSGEFAEWEEGMSDCKAKETCIPSPEYLAFRAAGCNTVGDKKRWDAAVAYEREAVANMKKQLLGAQFNAEELRRKV